MRVVIDGGGGTPAHRAALRTLLDGWDAVGAGDELHVVSPCRDVLLRCRAVSTTRRGGWRTVARLARAVRPDVVLHLGVGRPSVPDFPAVIVDPRGADTTAFAESVRAQAVRVGWLSAGTGRPALLLVPGPEPGRHVVTARRRRIAWAPAAQIGAAAAILSLSVAGTLSYAAVESPAPAPATTVPAATPSAGLPVPRRSSESSTTTTAPPGSSPEGAVTPSASDSATTTTPADATSPALSLPGVSLPGSLPTITVPDVTLPPVTVPTLPGCTTTPSIPVVSVPVACSPLVPELCPCP